MEKKAKKRDFGRPSKYRKEYCQVAYDALCDGKSKVQIAAILEVDKKTLDKWIRDYPEFLHSIEQGLVKAEHVWTQMGQDNMYSKEFNTKLYEMNMMNRFGWGKNVKQDHTLIVHEDMLKQLK